MVNFMVTMINNDWLMPVMMMVKMLVVKLVMVIKNQQHSQSSVTELWRSTVRRTCKRDSWNRGKCCYFFKGG